jgi:hypothetical protein
MKFLKSTLSIVALLAIGSMDARVRQTPTVTKTAPVTVPKTEGKAAVVKPKPTTEEISQYAFNYINNTKGNNSIENYVLVTKDNYDEQKASECLTIMFENVARNFPNADKESMKKELKDVFVEYTKNLDNKDKILKDVDDDLDIVIK